jgi:hypothetical protein
MLGTSKVIATLLAPRPARAGCVDAPEAGIGSAPDFLRTIARVVDIEPVRTNAATSVDLLRDFGGAQVSSVRWMPHL